MVREFGCVSARWMRFHACWLLPPVRPARLLNVSDLASPFQLSRPTIRDYITLLESVFLLESLSPWHSNRLSRLVKTPSSISATRSSLCTAWARRRFAQPGPIDAGQLLETFVLQELRRQASWNEASITFHITFAIATWREVDIVL